MCGYLIATEIRGAATGSLDAQHGECAKCMYGRRFGEGHTWKKNTLVAMVGAWKFGFFQGYVFKRSVELEGTKCFEEKTLLRL